MKDLTTEARKRYAKDLVSNPVFQEGFDMVEEHFIEQMINLDVDDKERYRCAVAVDAVRTLRRQIELLLVERPKVVTAA